MNNIEGEIKKILKLLNESERFADIINTNRIGSDIEKAVILEDAIKVCTPPNPSFYDDALILSLFKRLVS